MLKSLLILAAAFILAGCQNHPTTPEKDALYRYGVAGKNIAADVPAPTTDGARARLEAFIEACDEAIRIGGGK